MKKILKNEAVQSLIASLLCIVLGLLIGYVVLLLINHKGASQAILLVSLELEEVMSLSDRILVMYEGEIVGELDPKTTNVQELGLYMAGAKRDQKGGESA